MSAPMSALGRAAYAAERRDLRDALLSEYHAVSGLDRRTTEGRKIWGLRAALGTLGVDPYTAHEGALSYDRAIGQVTAAIDFVDVGIGPFDGDDRDPMPVRLVVTDGADDTPPSQAYLTPDEARTVARLLHKAAETVEAAWAERDAS